MRIVLLAGLLLLWSLSARAGGDITTATVAITNVAGTTNGQTITVNGSTRTWVSTVSLPATQILTNNTAATAATNLFNAIADSPFSPPLGLSWVASNSVALQGSPGRVMTVTLSAGWGTVSYTTNTLTPAQLVRVPYTVESAAEQTNVCSGVAAMVGSSASTNKIPCSAPAVQDLAGLTNAQTITGQKTFNNASNSFTGKFIGDGSQLVDLFGSNFAPSNNPTLYNPSLLNSDGNLIYANGGLNILDDINDDAQFARDVVASRYIKAGGGFYGNGFGLTNSAGSAYAPATNASLLNPSITGGVLQASLLTGTNIVAGDLAFQRAALASLANGNNAGIQVGTNVFVEVSGPTGSFTVNGINGQPNRDGKFLILLNRTGQNMTVAHDSGVDPTAGNRIYCLTGADKTLTGNGAATLIYSGAASRWILLSFTQ